MSDEDLREALRLEKARADSIEERFTAMVVRLREIALVSRVETDQETEKLRAERDEWKSRAEYAEAELSKAFDLPPTMGPTEGEAKRIVDLLRAQKRQLRARLVEARPWIGVCPTRPDLMHEVCLVRDLVADTLDEVKP